MAAQEYYSGGPINGAAGNNQRPPYPPSPPLQPQPSQSYVNPSPTGTAPPPYESFSNDQHLNPLPEQNTPRPQSQHQQHPPQPAPSHHVAFADGKRPHSQPPPQTQAPPPHQPFYHPPQQFNGYPTPPPTGYPPQQGSPFPPQQQPYPGQQYQQYPPQQQQQYFAPPPQVGRPTSYSNPQQLHFLQPNGRTPTPSYPPAGVASNTLSPKPPRGRYSKSHSPRPHSSSSSSSRSRSRSRDRDRKHRHHRHHNSDELAYGKDRGMSRRKKGDKGTTDSFLGAGLGGIIGDAIFPGLGTVGGALLGGYGGHKYGEGKDTKRDLKAARRYSDSRGRRRDGD